MAEDAKGGACSTHGQWNHYFHLLQKDDAVNFKDALLREGRKGRRRGGQEEEGTLIKSN
jgi:hypothetical protein